MLDTSLTPHHDMLQADAGQLRMRQSAPSHRTVVRLTNTSQTDTDEVDACTNAERMQCWHCITLALNSALPQ